MVHGPIEPPHRHYVRFLATLMFRFGIGALLVVPRKKKKSMNISIIKMLIKKGKVKEGGKANESWSNEDG